MRRVGRTTGWLEWLGAAKVTTETSSAGMHFDDGHLVLQAAAAGRGVSLGRLAYALDDLAARRLRVRHSGRSSNWTCSTTCSFRKPGRTSRPSRRSASGSFRRRRWSAPRSCVPSRATDPQARRSCPDAGRAEPSRLCGLGGPDSNDAVPQDLFRRAAQNHVAQIRTPFRANRDQVCIDQRQTPGCRIGSRNTGTRNRHRTSSPGYRSVAFDTNSWSWSASSPRRPA